MKALSLLGILLILHVPVIFALPVACPYRFSTQDMCNACQRPRTVFESGAPALRCGFTVGFQAIKDIFLLHASMISKESFIVAAATMPAYLTARLMDEPLQCHFFSHHNHLNINQFPKWCHELVRFGIGIPIVIFGSQLFLSEDPEWREAAWMLLLGLPFVIFGKNLIKQFDAQFCLRPWHQDFVHHHKRGGGGFPSGHMAQATYIAALYGMRFGPRLAVPLTFFAAGLGIIFLNCNRHYLSQLVAGAGLGALYACAANKVIDMKLAEGTTINFGFARGGPCMSATYRY